LRPELYRQLALYLQVMRKGLLHDVQQASFHLATQIYPERYGALSSIERAELHRRLRALVQRCSCLLTIEQLSCLGRQLEQEERKRRQQQQAAILASLEAPQRSRAEPLPEGSVSLEMDLPLSAELFSEGFSGLVGISGPLGEGKGQDDGQEGEDQDDHRDLSGLPEGEMFDFLSDEPDDADLDEIDREDQELEAHRADGSGGEPLDGDGYESSDVHGQPEPWNPSEVGRRGGGPGGENGQELKLLQSLFAMASETMGRQRQLDSDEMEVRDSASESAPTDESNDALRLLNPSALLRWWDSHDRALQRRLRNLSHAINVDLLRLRLTRSLMPVNLLDAVLEGQIDPLPAPANLLRLHLPFASDEGGLQLETHGLLLRPGDLEYGLPPLRTCRKRLERHRLALRKMAHHHRHWQRRVQALEAEKQWLQDNNQVNPGPAPAS
jgi:hypothetical protein